MLENSSIPDRVTCYLPKGQASNQGIEGLIECCPCFLIYTCSVTAAFQSQASHPGDRDGFNYPQGMYSLLVIQRVVILQKGNFKWEYFRGAS